MSEPGQAALDVTALVESALDVANNAVMALSLLGPIGALASDILSVVPAIGPATC